MKYVHIESQSELEEFCQSLADAPEIGFDTEFVAEFTYRPQLCLIQVAAGSRLAVIDTLKVDDVTPFWRALAEPGHETIVHAGREELCFCLDAIGQRPHQLVDVQLAAGLVTNDYPAGYGALNQRLLGKRVPKGETRTDWRKRPLTKRQLDYAISDVEHLTTIYDKLKGMLAKHDRLGWLDEEMQAWQEDIEASRTRKRWRRVSGSGNLSPASLSIVRELWLWRDSEAERRDCPPRKILRDDLIVELAKRRRAGVSNVKAIRGMERGDLRPHLGAISECIERALAMPPEELPRNGSERQPSQWNMLTQYLGAALTSVCRDAQVATSLVATTADIRELIAWQVGHDDDTPKPALMQGWRAEIVGDRLARLLTGELSIRIANFQAEQPFSFEPSS
ncbi:MAG: ribonuclease D [Planctomycetales bacterium]|nr:ribonuclease D [Planctomycetales bacterium]